MKLILEQNNLVVPTLTLLTHLSDFKTVVLRNGERGG